MTTLWTTALGPRSRRSTALAAVLAAGGALLTGCGEERSTVVVSSTTSTEDSGLFDVLIPAFEEAHPGLAVHVLAVGSGQALELGRRGDADVVLVHAPAAESAFVAEGHGLGRRPLMYNDFVLVGPPADPAGIRGLKVGAEALRRIAERESPFVSRGDDSGTHRKELALWRLSGTSPGGPWYMEAGQGMGEVLRVAAEKGAYALSDRSTFLFMPRLALEILVEGDPRLVNPYGVIAVRGAKNPEGAGAFVDWITAREGQALIAGYGVDRFGQPLFHPGEPPAEREPTPVARATRGPVR